MKNIALVLSYDGTNYNGWQIQKNGPSIQESMETALFRLLGEKVHVSGVGRTDSGVHARRYVASFKTERCTIPTDRLPFALNSFLPLDIAVSGAAEVPEDFDARFDCTRKEYAYYIFPSTLRDPFHARYAYRYNYPLDAERMHEGAQRFVGTHDFASVRSQGTPVKSTVRTIFWCDVTRLMISSVSAYAATAFCTTWFAPFRAPLSMSAAASCGLTTLPMCLRPATANRPVRRCLPAVCS